MIIAQNLSPGIDCSSQFRAAYENRYCWSKDFKGYQGKCSWENKKNKKLVEGSFSVQSDMKTKINHIDDPEINKAISSQLSEVVIHRVRRSFEETHGKNSFVSGEVDNVGMEVLVGGRNKGDKYRIKNNVITMVHRHIHGSLIEIFTKEIFNTGNGYLSKIYTSQYLNPVSSEPLSAINLLRDDFVLLYKGGPWVLSSRVVDKESFQDNEAFKHIYRFYDFS